MKIENSRIVRSRLDSRKVLLGFLQDLHHASNISYASVNTHITTKVSKLNLRKDICKKTLELFGLIQSSADGSKFRYTDELPTMDVVLEFTKFLNNRRNASRNSSNDKRTISGDYLQKKVQGASLPLTGTTVSFVPCESQLALEFDNLLSNCADEQPVLNLNKKYTDQLGFVKNVIELATGKIESELQANRTRIDYLTEEIKKLGGDNRELQTKITENRQILADLDKHERARFCLEYGRSEYKRKYSEDFDMSLAKYADMDLSAYI